MDLAERASLGLDGASVELDREKGALFSRIEDQEGGSGRRADDWELKEARKQNAQRVRPRVVVP